MNAIINFFMGCSWVNKRQGRSSVSSPPIAVFLKKQLNQLFMGCSWVNKRQGRRYMAPALSLFLLSGTASTFHGLFMGEQTAGAALNGACPIAVFTYGAASTFHGLFMGEQTAGAALNSACPIAVFTYGAASTFHGLFMGEQTAGAALNGVRPIAVVFT